jgi:hypothetical protein
MRLKRTLRPGESGTNYVIDSPRYLTGYGILCLNRCEEEFRYHLLGSAAEESTEDGDDEADDKENAGDADESKPLNPKTLRSQKMDEIRPIMLSFFDRPCMSCPRQRTGTSDFYFEVPVQVCSIHDTVSSIAESMLKTLTGLWSALDSSEDYKSFV